MAVACWVGRARGGSSHRSMPSLAAEKTKTKTLAGRVAC